MPKTEVLSIAGSKQYDDAIRRGAEILRSGGIVGFPTETVYGLAALFGHEEGEAKLRKLKNRPRQPFTVMIAEPNHLRNFQKRVSKHTWRLVEKFWPGPLTVVIPCGRKGSMGFRCPDSAVASDLARQAPPGILAPSANPRGEPPALTAKQVLRYFDGKIDAVINGTVPLGGKPSTVVKLFGKKYEILREGAIPRADIQQAFGRTTLFVCTGNTCRSPMAQELARWMLAKKLGMPRERLAAKGHTIISAGIAAGNGVPASRGAVEALADWGIELRNHKSRPLTPQLVQRADLILCMTRSHLETVLDYHPEASDKVRLLDPNGKSFADPIGRPTAVYKKLAARMEKAIKELLDEL